MPSVSRATLIATLAVSLPAAAQPAPDLTVPQEVPPVAAPDLTVPQEVPPVAAPEAAPDDAITWRYDKGLIASKGDDLELKLGLRTQSRFEVTRPEAKEEFENRFFLPRIRLQLEGFAYGKANAYKLEFDAGNQGFAAIKDFFVERAFTPALRLRLGQWKKPFSRQELTSDFALAFTERQASNSFAGSGRDLGVALHNGYEKSPEGLEWALGVFNGTTEKSTIKITCEDPADASTCKAGLPSNVPTDLLPEAVARVGWNHGGIKGYSELDLEGGPLRFAAAASYRIRFEDFVDSSLYQQAVGVDAIVKVAGFDLSGAGFLSKVGEADAQLGGFGQLGYLVVPKHLALLARVGVTPIVDSEKHKVEFLGGLNVLGSGHNLKLVVDGGVIHDTGAKTDDVVGRVQAQLVL
jgi:hypothetical protein